MLLHQSSLSALSRCPAEYGYKRAGHRGEINGSTAYGTVMHGAIQSGEIFLHGLRLEGADVRRPELLKQAAEKALDYFTYYWNPAHLTEVSEPVPDDGWLPQRSWSELNYRGVETIKTYFKEMAFDDHSILAIELGFVVPIPGTWDEDLNEPHMLGGYIDKLSVGFHRGNKVLLVSDWKTGVKQPKALRWNLQFSCYMLASLQPEFWTGNGGESGWGAEQGMELFERYKDLPRRGQWIDLHRIKLMDAGERVDQDYRRVAVAAQQWAATVKADVFPLNISGETCNWCSMRKVCGGVGLPEQEPEEV